MGDEMNITILDPTMSKDEVRIVRSPEEILGFNIKNETDKHLYIEVIRKNGILAPGECDVEELVIRL